MIDIILFLARQNIAFRGHRNENAESLYEVITENRGNFLELVLLVGKYDPLLKHHIEKVTRKQKGRKTSFSKKKGRGSSVTFLSKTTVNKLLHICCEAIREKLVADVKEVGKFSVQLDSTQHVKDQVAVILRYVEAGVVHEHLYRLLCMKGSSTAINLHNALQEALEQDGLKMSDVIGDSFDGASNMSGVHGGLQAEIQKASPESIYIHCYAHALNLVMTRVTSDSNEARNLFGLISSVANFFSQSHKRMDVWTEVNKDAQRRLQKIGETRWWSKDVALKNIFGTFDCPDELRMETVLKSLDAIKSSKEFEPKATYEASTLGQCLRSFETILCAFTFLRIFQYSTPVSKYLQTSGLDLLSGYNMAVQLADCLSSVREDFEAVHRKAKVFAEGLAEKGLNTMTSLKTVRPRRKAKISPNESSDSIDEMGETLQPYEIKHTR